MSVSMYSHVTIEISNDEKMKYTLHLPVGVPYENAIKVMDLFKESIEQMQKNAKRAAEDSQKEENNKVNDAKEN